MDKLTPVPLIRIPKPVLLPKADAATQKPKARQSRNKVNFGKVKYPKINYGSVDTPKVDYGDIKMGHGVHFKGL